MQALTSVVIATIYSGIRQSHAIKLQLLGEQAISIKTPRA
jgi:hypothetical protein